MKNPHILDIYSDYLLASFSIVTATGLSQLLDDGYSHDQISRFLAQGKFSSKDFWKMVKGLIRKVENDNAVLIVDDTLEEKPHSTENDIICWHWDHSKEAHVKGINLLNFLYSTQTSPGSTINLPVAFDIIEKTEKYLDPKTKLVKRRSPFTKNELVQERLRTLVQLNQLKFKYILWDIWYSSKENLEFVALQLKKHFVVALKSNRSVALSLEDKLEGKFVKVEQIEFHSNHPLQVWIKGLAFPVLLAKQVFTNKDGSSGELFLITNDLTLSYPDICTIYQKRWNVEVFHKSLKQNAALEKSPTKYEVTQSNHVFASMIAYCKLEILKFQEQMNHFQLKSRLYLQAIKAAFSELQKMKANPLAINQAQEDKITLIS
jgi:hypothetical protein